MTTVVLPPSLRLTGYAHQVVAKILGPGDTAVDATVGNGHDTCFLLDLVGPAGLVWGFDIQADALSRTSARCGHHPGMKLIHDGHENLASWVTGPVRAIMFNLGYLPSGDKFRITRRDTTLQAITAALGLLERGGIVTVLVYRGHSGGTEEAEAVEQKLESVVIPSSRLTKVVREAGGPESPYLLIWES
jgi:hypothetical protein